jgi:hypothetical protein
MLQRQRGARDGDLLISERHPNHQQTNVALAKRRESGIQQALLEHRAEPVDHSRSDLCGATSELPFEAGHRRCERRHSATLDGQPV